MGKPEGPSMLSTVACLLALTVIAVRLVQILPNEVAAPLVAWILTSFPIGVLIGHCALSGD